MIWCSNQSQSSSSTPLAGLTRRPFSCPGFARSGSRFARVVDLRFAQMVGWLLLNSSLRSKVWSGQVSQG